MTNTLTRNFTGDLRTTYKVSDNLSTNYSMNTRRDLSDPETVVFSFNPKKFKLGRETSYRESFGASYNPSIFGFLTHSFNFSAAYSEKFNTTNDTRDASASKSYGVGGSFDLKKLFGAGKSRKSSVRDQIVKEARKDKEEQKRSIFTRVINPIAGVMRFLTGWIDPFSYSYKESFSYSYPGLLERAQLKFRFGLTNDAGARPSTSTTSFRSNSASKTTSYSFSSGTKLLGGLKTDVSFSRTIRRDIIKAGSRAKSVSTTFPDITFAIRPLTTIKFFNPIIKRFSPRTKFSRSKSENFNLTTGFRTSEKTTTSQNPLLSFNFAFIKGMQINVKTDRSVTTDKSYNSATGALSRTTRNTSRSTGFATKYSFTWPTGVKIPIMGRLRFKSTMSMSVDVSTRSQKTEESTGNSPMNSMGERSDLMISPSISYSFSSQIKGGLTGRWQDTNDKQRKRKSHVRELRIWVDIRF